MKKTTAIILTLVILLPFLSPGIAVAADTEKYHDYAINLYSIGLFKGTDIGFELTRIPTRLEGAVMFVRLLGAEDEALNANYSHPFTDVPSWGDAYVGYLYKNELTNGISATEFGSYLDLKDIEYVTFGLRALGYADKGSDADFSWDMSTDFAYQYNILSEDLHMDLESIRFTRGHVAWISCELLNAELKGASTNLIESLVQSGSISQNNAGSIFEEYSIGKKDLPVMGDLWPSITAEYNAPTENFISRYGFDWHIFGMDYENYVQVGEENGRITGLLVASTGYSYEKYLEIGMSKSDVIAAYGSTGLTEIRKTAADGTVIRYMLNNSDKATYVTDGGDYITYYYDMNNENIMAFLVIKKETEESTHDTYFINTATMEESLETQVYHITNAFRVQKGRSILAKSIAAYEIAGNHSDNMVRDNFFDHTDMQGNSVGNRATIRSIPYMALGENIAMGYKNSIDMVNGWLNSKTGHREVLLGNYDYIGIGVSIKNGETMYCTQDYWR